MSQRLGKYELLTHLASGGMAEVYAARSLEHSSDVVIVKQMLPQFAENADFVEMFLDEGRVVSLLKHPNVVRMHDFGFQGERPFLAMEYLHGVDLRTLMRALRGHGAVMPPQCALSIIVGLCAGLHHAHEARSIDGYAMDIVHRDVSPQNVVVTFDGVPKLIDFGIAKSRGRAHETRAGALKGKVPYMAPEQVRGAAIDRRTDVYAVGVMLYELVTGRRPYVVDKTGEPRGEFSLMMAIVGGKIARPRAVRPDVAPAVEQIILRALAGAPTDRYPTTDAMERDLRSAAATLEMELGTTPVAKLIRETFGVQHERWRDVVRKGSEDLATEIESVQHMRDATTEGQDPLSIEVTELNDADVPAPSTALSVVSLDARLDENFHGAERARTWAGRVIVDMGAVERISSFGVREWLELQRSVDARGDAVTLYLARCSEPVVTQLGMIRAFVGRAQLVSFLAPYLCVTCGAAFNHCFDCERDAVALDGSPPLIPCPTCGESARLDDDASYFTPLRPHLGKLVPDDVRGALARLGGTDQVIEKRIEGSVTRLRFLRPIDRSFRWARLLDGVEGIVELELAAARIDATTGDATLQALRSLDPDVTVVHVHGAPPHIATAIAALPRCEVRSVAIDGRCPSCAAPRSVLISANDLAALNRREQVSVLCRRCDTPLTDLELGAPAPRVSGSMIPLTAPAVAPTPRFPVARIAVIAITLLVVLAAAFATIAVVS